MHDDLHESLRPARGVIYGAGLSMLAWLALAGVVLACVGIF